MNKFISLGGLCLSLGLFLGAIDFDEFREHLKKGNWRDALSYADERVEGKPDSAEWRYNRGLVYVRMGDYDSACVDFESCFHSESGEVRYRAFFNAARALWDAYLDELRMKNIDRGAIRIEEAEAIAFLCGADLELERACEWFARAHTEKKSERDAAESLEAISQEREWIELQLGGKPGQNNTDSRDATEPGVRGAPSGMIPQAGGESLTLKRRKEVQSLIESLLSKEPILRNEPFSSEPSKSPLKSW